MSRAPKRVQQYVYLSDDVIAALSFEESTVRIKPQFIIGIANFEKECIAFRNDRDKRSDDAPVNQQDSMTRA